MFRIPLYLQIIIALVMGLLWGGLSVGFDWDASLTVHYVKPIGTIFIRALQLIAIPIILSSLITGVAGLDDVSKLSKLGSKTLLIFFCTTVITLVVGLSLVNAIKPGKYIDEEVRTQLVGEYNKEVVEKTTTAASISNKGPLQFIVDMVPSNFFESASENKNMLQIVLFALLLGIAAALVPDGKAKPFLSMMASFNEVMLKVIVLIMRFAPFGVFALMANLVVEVPNMQLLTALGMYCFTVVLGLGIMLFVVYPLIVRLFSGKSIKHFLRAMKPVQLLAFSTSSSAATLPLNMLQCENKLGLNKQVCSFVLPLGATVNMDGTCLYQGVAAVFIAQAIGLELTLADQAIIVLTALLASVGSAGVPGAGMVMLVIVLESVGIPLEYLALIMAPDRILDMFRTAVNITGDAATAIVVDRYYVKDN